MSPLYYPYGGAVLIAENIEAGVQAQQKKTVPVVIVAGIVALVLFFFLKGR